VCVCVCGYFVTIDDIISRDIFLMKPKMWKKKKLDERIVYS